MGTKGKRWKVTKPRKGVVPSSATREKMSQSQRERREREAKLRADLAKQQRAVRRMERQEIARRDREARKKKGK